MSHQLYKPTFDHPAYNGLAKEWEKFPKLEIDLPTTALLALLFQFSKKYNLPAFPRKIIR
jgi:hypothetical protein